MAVTTFNVDNANIFFSPGGWELSGSTYARTIPIGSYVKTAFVGTDCSIELDLAYLTANAQTVVIAYQVDGGAIQASGDLPGTTTTFVVATGLADAAHTLKFWFKQGEEFLGAWLGGPDFFKFTGIKVTGASPALNAPTLRPKRWLCFGDSITKGENVLGGGYNQNQMDPTLTYAQQAAAFLNAEIGAIAFSSEGWNTGAYPDIPAFHVVGDTSNQSWKWIKSGVARSFTGIDGVMVNLGTNDALVGTPTPDATVRAAVTDFLTSMRTALPTGAEIFLLIPFNGNSAGYKRTAITNGFNDYQGTPDSKAYLIDLGPNGALPTSMLDSPDVLHPTQAGHDRLAPRVVTAIRVAKPVGLFRGS